MWLWETTAPQPAGTKLLDEGGYFDESEKQRQEKLDRFYRFLPFITPDSAKSYFDSGDFSELKSLPAEKSRLLTEQVNMEKNAEAWKQKESNEKMSRINRLSPADRMSMIRQIGKEMAFTHDKRSPVYRQMKKLQQELVRDLINDLQEGVEE